MQCQPRGRFWPPWELVPAGALQEGCLLHGALAPPEDQSRFLLSLQKPALCSLHSWTWKPRNLSPLPPCGDNTHCQCFLLLPHHLGWCLCRAGILLPVVIIQHPPTPVTIIQGLSSCLANGSDMQTKWNNSEWSWQPGNFRNKLIWQGVFITLQGTGWSDRNRSWQIDYLLENGTPRLCREMRGGVWSGSGRWGWLARWKRGECALLGSEILSFECFIKHSAGSQLSPVAPVTVRRLCQCTSATVLHLTLLSPHHRGVCLLLTFTSWVPWASDLPQPPLWTWPGRVKKPRGDFAPTAQLWSLLSKALCFYTCKTSRRSMPRKMKLSITWFISLLYCWWGHQASKAVKTFALCTKISSDQYQTCKPSILSKKKKNPLTFLVIINKFSAPTCEYNLKSSLFFL